MFTGIIEKKGQIEKINSNKAGKEFIIKSDIGQNKKIGESISVDGVCTTLTKKDKDNFTFLAIPETLEITTFSELKEGDVVNLESSLTLKDGINGHLVQGHVDCTGKVVNVNREGKYRISINFPNSIKNHLAFKGSICLNGVSLTISDLRKDFFSVDLIPETLEKTNLANLKINDKVNIEIDLISRYLERLLQKKESESKYQFLAERGFL